MPTPAEELAFTAPILARYGDDGPRLIYADFLDESDDPADHARADLIRVQCALARLPDDHPRRPSLRAAETDLLARYQNTWAAPIAGLAAGVEFRRGLLDTVAVDAGTFLARGGELFRRAPVRRVRLLAAGRHLARLADCPHLARVRELDLTGNDLGNGGLNLLVRSPHLGRVVLLDLSFNGVCDGGVRLLAGAATLPRLRALYLTDNGRVGDDGLKALAESPHAAGLHTLDVSGNAVTDVGVRAAAEPKSFARLHTFRVFANPIGDAGVSALVRSPLLARLLEKVAVLDLRDNQITAAGAAALVSSPFAAAIERLNLSGNWLGDAGLLALAESPHLGRLRRLTVGRNHVGDQGAVGLARSPLMSRLTHLDLSKNQITETGVDALWAARGSFRTVLKLDGNLVTGGDPAGHRLLVGNWLANDLAGSGPPYPLQPEVSRVLRRYSGTGAG
ncbi:MAG: TIGR02996 domain-containing protein [Gemmataceae bacterium]